ncbi:hypothetical protein D3C80_1909120 [compost metagenome]
MTDPAYNAGALELGTERTFLEGFVRIFAGEQEAIQAIVFAPYLEEDDQQVLLLLAQITTESASQYRAWVHRFNSPG